MIHKVSALVEVADSHLGGHRLEVMIAEIFSAFGLNVLIVECEVADDESGWPPRIDSVEAEELNLTLKE